MNERRLKLNRMREEDGVDEMEEIKAFTNSNDLRIAKRNRHTQKRISKLGLKIKGDKE